MAKSPSKLRRKVSALGLVAVGWLCAFGAWLAPAKLFAVKVALLAIARVLPQALLPRQCESPALASSRITSESFCTRRSFSASSINAACDAAPERNRTPLEVHRSSRAKERDLGTPQTGVTTGSARTCDLVREGP